MATINVSLPETLKTYIEQQVAEGDYSTTSEYFRHLVREDQRRKAREHLEGLLLHGLNSGVGMEADESYWREKGKKVTARLKNSGKK